MIKILPIAFLVFFLQSCNDGLEGLKEPDNLIPKEQMIDVMTNMLILEGHIQTTYSTVNRYYKVMSASGKAYLKTQNITEKQYEESFIYYNSMHEEYKVMLDTIMERLQKESIELQKNPSDSLI
ncbi:hypothetical protein D3C87_37430 [compost metagenome]